MKVPSPCCGEGFLNRNRLHRHDRRGLERSVGADRASSGFLGRWVGCAATPLRRYPDLEIIREYVFLGSKHTSFIGQYVFLSTYF